MGQVLLRPAGLCPPCWLNLSRDSSKVHLACWIKVQKTPSNKRHMPCDLCGEKSAWKKKRVPWTSQPRRPSARAVRASYSRGSTGSCNASSPRRIDRKKKQQHQTALLGGIRPTTCGWETESGIGLGTWRLGRATGDRTRLIARRAVLLLLLGAKRATSLEIWKRL